MFDSCYNLWKKKKKKDLTAKSLDNKTAFPPPILEQVNENTHN